MIKKILIFILLLAVISCAGAFIYLNGKQPVRSGELELSGLTKPVNVKYDHFGVPHLTASNDNDLYRAFGFVHAQDRLFQMEMTRRLAQGRLSEVLGKDTIGVDKLFRTLDIGRFAVKWIEQIKLRSDPKMIEVMQSYLDGVNQYVANGTRPIEFDILGMPDHLYTLEDIASISGYMSFSFAQGLRDDPLVHHLSQKLGENYLQDLGILYTPGFEQIPVDPLLTENVSASVSKVVESLQSAGLVHGSNSWIIAPSRSESGQALFVNDPHIAFSQPSVWYEAQLKSPDTDVYGHFLSLVPLPLLGLTKEHAWGLTMFENDDMDLYAEKVNPENPEQYWAIDHWQDFEVRDEIIGVNGEDSVIFQVRSSRHGSIVNSIFDGVPGGKYGLKSANQPLALWWTFLDTDNDMMEAFYLLPKANTVEKAKLAASKIHSPGLNLMYANKMGDIAWWASAKLPIRPKHVNPKFILDGSSGKDDILGYYDFSHNPQQVNPESGYLYSANNQAADMGDGLIPGYYSPTDRPTRIVELLSKKEKFNPDDMKKMLMDNTTPSAIFFKHVSLPVLKAANLNKIEKAALEEFSRWQGNHSPGEVGATIYNRFRMALMRLAMQDELGESLYTNFQFGFLMDRSIWRILDKESSPWWDNMKTTQVETRDELIVSAWREATQFLKQRFGKDIDEWTWANDVKMVHEHPLGRVAPLDKLFNVGPLPSEAGIEAINNLMFVQVGDELKIMMGPSTRRVIDFGDIENTWGILPTGQSGIVSDPHYDDQAVDYSKGKFRHHYITDKDVLENLEEELILVP
ncbi:MAG: penicillin acylase family protein [Kangiellaceae bacterium]|nr:penicillin acylase family protein [Kangiellaceae bacterium]